MNTIFIGIAGGTGSGKTTLTEHLKQHFGDDISVVHHDSYYKYQDRPFEERCKQNYDHPDAFETDLMVEQLKELKAGKAIRCPVYSYADHQRTSETELIRPSKVVIVEGILIFQDPRLREMLDIKIFVETDADVRDRGYLYWRLLSADAKLAKQVVLQEKPTIQPELEEVETVRGDEA